MAITDIITRQWILDTYCSGLEGGADGPTLDDGTPYPEELWLHSSRFAADQVGAALGLNLGANKTHTQRFDITDADAMSGLFLAVDNRPIAPDASKASGYAVEAFGVQIGHIPVTSYPDGWINVMDAIAGQIQIIPTVGAPSISLSTSVLPFSLGPYTYRPGAVTVTYTSGFERNLTGTLAVSEGSKVVTGIGTAFRSEVEREDWILVGEVARRVHRVISNTEIRVRTAFDEDDEDDASLAMAYPEALIGLCGIIAAAAPLDTAGDLIAGAGIASSSISVDGISTSINTTSSATNSGYGARILSQQKRLEQLWAECHGRFRGLEMFAI